METDNVIKVYTIGVYTFLFEKAECRRCGFYSPISVKCNGIIDCNGSTHVSNRNIR